MHLTAVFIFILVSKIQSQQASSPDTEDTEYVSELKQLRGYLLRKFMQTLPEIVKSWMNFKKDQGLILTPDQNRKYFFVYGKMKLFIEEFMANTNRPFEVGENSLTHLDREQYFKTAGFVQSYSEEPNIQLHAEESPTSNLKAIPVYVDWRAKGHVNSVRDQGNCGSCYAFAATNVVESHRSIKYGKLEVLSEQSIVDCSYKFGNYQCNGGNYEYTFTYLKKYPFPLSSTYPYNEQPNTCRLYEDPRKAIVKDFKSVPSGDEHNLAFTTSKSGPIAIAFDVKDPAFQSFKSGVYTSTYCSTTLLNHAMTVVGVGEKPRPHFIVRNSWSPSWGMGGYINVEKNGRNVCGIATYAFYPIV
ncbi:Cathepsin L [Thelohanellus kitauei]|uniref:Cathepsin L n=1 Tax=Thelohanellus kitauei TaxID=669202 RepID=A0A0C2M2H2_THEKT|nr:Cathepsin L [Thelohanellus kitauei]